MIKKLLNFILPFFREVYLYESKKNKKSISFNNYFLQKYRSKKFIKNNIIEKYLETGNKEERFKRNQTLFVLFFKKKAVCFGWMNKNSTWKITEINKKINKKKTFILYDFFTPPNLRNKGFYTKILNLIKNLNTKNKFLIYCLKTNISSRKGITKSKFILVEKMKGF